MGTSMYTNGMLRPKLPARLMAFEESRGREREIVTFLAHQPQYIDALGSYDLSSQDFAHSSVGCKQSTSVVDRSGRRLDRTADVLVEHSELAEAIELFWRSRGRISSLMTAIDLLFSNKLAAARAPFDQRQLQVRWEGSKRLVEAMYQSQPLSAEDFFDALAAMSRVSGKKAGKSVQRSSRGRDDLDDEYEFDSAEPEEEEPPPPRRPLKKQTRRASADVHAALRQQKPVRPDVLEFDPSHLDPAAPRHSEPVNSPVSFEPAPATRFVPAQSPITPPRIIEPPAPVAPPVYQPAPPFQPVAQYQPAPRPRAIVYPDASPSRWTVQRQEQHPDAVHVRQADPQRASSIGPKRYSWDPAEQTHGVAPEIAPAPRPAVSHSLAPKVKRFAPAAPQPVVNTRLAEVQSAAPRSPLRLPPDMAARSGQPLAQESRGTNSVQPLSSFSQQISAQLFDERRVVIPAPCHPMDTCLSGGFATGQLYALSTSSEMAADDFLSQCADYAALNGIPAVLISSRLTRERSWVRGISRMGKIESRAIEKRQWLSSSDEQVGRVKSQIARAAEKYNRAAERVTLIECQPGITATQVKEIAAEVRRFHLLDETKPILIAIDAVPRNEEGNSDPAAVLKQIARECFAAMIVADDSNSARDGRGFAHRLLSDDPSSLAADCFLRIDAEEPGKGDDLDQKYVDHPAALSKLRQLRKYFPPDPDSSERSTFAVVRVSEPGGRARQDVVLMYQQAFHNFAGIEKIFSAARGIN